MHRAATWNINPASIQILLKAGLDPNDEDNAGETPFDLATRLERPVALKAFENNKNRVSSCRDSLQSKPNKLDESKKITQ